MNARNRDSCRQLFKNRIQKLIILTPDLVVTLHTPNANLITFQKSRGKSGVYAQRGDVRDTNATLGRL